MFDSPWEHHSPKYKMIRFNQFIIEKVLSIGLNPKHEKFREAHRQEFHDMLHHAYKPIGGYAGAGSGTKEESDAIHADISQHIIKATKRHGKITSVNIYKKMHGRKSVASATDGTPEGKRDFLKNKLEDHEQKRAWGEVSGKVEHLTKKLGVPMIKSKRAAKLIGKDVEHTEDGYHYKRKIGNEIHTKVAVGHPKPERNKAK